MLLSNPDCPNVAFIYDISRAGMHLWVVRKSHGVAELRYSGSAALRGLRSKVTGRRGWHPIGAGYHCPAGKLSFFSRHLRNHSDGLRPARRRRVPTSGYGPRVLKPQRRIRKCRTAVCRSSRATGPRPAVFHPDPAPAGWIFSSSAMKSCVTRSACAANISSGIRRARMTKWWR